MATDTLPKCVTCGRDMRPRGVKGADWPGTVAMGSKGKCTSCYQSRREVKREAAADDIAELPCVLVRVYLTPKAYKALKAARVDIHKELAQHAELLARQTVMKAAS